MSNHVDRRVTGRIKKRVKVKKSSVGRGVFAREAVIAKDVIAEISGQIMRPDFDSNYCMELGGKAVLEPAWPFRFLNHSCQPNCELKLWKHRKIRGQKIRRLWLRAVRDIVAGEELTIDYAWPVEFAVPCHCGAQKCRGWVVAKDVMARLDGRDRRRRA